MPDFGYDWYCTTTATCCPGTWQSTCMPAGYTCCSTGYYCLPDEDCMLDSSGLTQYCVAADSDGSDATRSAEVEGAQETGGGGGDNGGSTGGFNEDVANGRRVNLAWLLGVVGVGAGMVML